MKKPITIVEAILYSTGAGLLVAGTAFVICFLLLPDYINRLADSRGLRMQLFLPFLLAFGLCLRWLMMTTIQQHRK